MAEKAEKKIRKSRLSIRDLENVKVRKSRDGNKDIIIITGLRPVEIKAELAGIQQMKENLVKQRVFLLEQLGDVIEDIENADDLFKAYLNIYGSDKGESSSTKKEKK